MGHTKITYPTGNPLTGLRVNILSVISHVLFQRVETSLINFNAGIFPSEQDERKVSAAFVDLMNK